MSSKFSNSFASISGCGGNLVKSNQAKLRESGGFRGISPQHMKPDLTQAQQAEILVYNFITENPTWAIKSIIEYCLKQYHEFNVTPELISYCMTQYIIMQYPPSFAFIKR